MRALVFANGTCPNRQVARQLAAEANLIVCANGGTHHALSLGVRPDVVIGDLDSLTDEARRDLERHGAAICPHPVRKDQTDLELALV